MNQADHDQASTAAPLDDATRRLWLAGVIASILRGSAFEKPGTWPFAIIVIRKGVSVASEERRVTSRTSFIGWAIANDLPSLAEGAQRKVPRGHVLAYLEIDVESAAGGGFAVVDIVGAARSLSGKRGRHA